MHCRESMRHCCSLFSALAKTNEAIELAKIFSTEDSGKFVNGVLAAIARQIRPV